MTENQADRIATDTTPTSDTPAASTTSEPATDTGATYTIKEACALVGLTRDAWTSWQKRGLLPRGRIGKGREHDRRVLVFTQDEVDAARAAVERSGLATPEHTITYDQVVEMLGISKSRMYEMIKSGRFPPGRWATPAEGNGRGNRRKMFTPAEVEDARAALDAFMNQGPEIDGQPAITLKDAAARIGLSRAQWYAWQKKGWAPMGTPHTWPGFIGKEQVYTTAQIDELVAAIERGEHPGASQIATPRHTITKEEAARLAGVGVHAWHELSQRGQLPEGRWTPNPKGTGKGGLRKLYTPEDVEALKRAMAQLEAERRPTIDGEPALTASEAAEKINISYQLFRLWDERGWLPEAHQAPRDASGQMMYLYTPEQIDEVKAAVDRGEHPGAQGRGTAEHTVTRHEAARQLGITAAKWSRWEKDGIVPPGKLPPLSPNLGLDGGRKLWTPEQVEDVRAKATEMGILEPAATPEHVLTRQQAAELVGISEGTWTYWCRRGVIPTGRWRTNPEGSGHGGLRRMHSMEEVRQARAALDEIGFGRAPNATEAHTLTQREAARLLGVEATALQGWEKRGLMPMGAWARATKGPALRKMYTPAQVEEGRERLKKHGVRCFAKATDEHTHTSKQAARFIGVPWGTFHHWEHQGRTPIGAWGSTPSNRGRCKMYTLAELEAFAEELEKLHKPYADPDRPGVVRVPIRSWKKRMEALIDADDLHLVEGKHWNYSERSDQYETRGVVILSTTRGRQTPLKQIIAGVRGHRWRIRHANGDFLDCRRENLVVLDSAQQSYGNKKIKMRAGYEPTSKYKGVCWDEDRGKWLAQINKDGKHHHLGRFDDEIDAADAYDNAARELFGEHAYLNFDGIIDRTKEEPRSAA
ncbi:MAG: helix-turn-helix domain-containing protein [Phycisphaerales bacterium]|jgi:DNA-binding transcriptional MerR regulator/predicted DNA-binding transcriptional regulator AlpA